MRFQFRSPFRTECIDTSEPPTWQISRGPDLPRRYILVRPDERLSDEQVRTIANAVADLVLSNNEWRGSEVSSGILHGGTW